MNIAKPFAIALLSFALNGRAQVVVFTFDVPNAHSTRIVGINNSGQSAGNYTKYLPGTEYNASHGFRLDRQGHATYFDFPGAAETWVTGINDRGVIVGNFFVFPDFNTSYCYLRSASGEMTMLSIPNPNGATVVNRECAGINDSGDVVGTVLLDKGIRSPFVRDSQGNVHFYRTMDGCCTHEMYINEVGDIAGNLSFAAGKATHAYVGFLIRKEDSQGEHDTVIEVSPAPLSVYFGSVLTGLNGAGDVAGYFDHGDTLYGFLRDHNGAVISFPRSGPCAINDNGVIVGGTWGTMDVSIYLRDPSGAVTLKTLGGSPLNIYISSINENGDAAGFYEDYVSPALSNQHGLIIWQSQAGSQACIS